MMDYLDTVDISAGSRSRLTVLDRESAMRSDRKRVATAAQQNEDRQVVVRLDGCIAGQWALAVTGADLGAIALEMR